jgi:hypothetical protein
LKHSKKNFNEQFFTSHPHIHKVIDVILNIQVKTELKISSITNNINNYPRKEFTEAIKTKINLWKKYETGEINEIQYIELIGNRFNEKKN